MNWRIFNAQSQGTDHKDRFATVQEMRATFDAEFSNLYWIALLITGDPILAKKSVVDASGLQKTSSAVFRDWLTRWAHSATAREAARSVRDVSTTSAPRYSSWTCGHIDHAPLSPEQIRALGRIDPREVSVHLDHLARTVLVLRGIQGASFSDCSMLINVSRRTVTGAYCHAVEWLQQYTQFDASVLDAKTSGVAEAPR